jgi:hypothetical protein
MATPTTLPASFSAGAVLTASQLNNMRGAFRILQIVSATRSTLFTSSSTTYTDVTTMTATITPSATSSQVLVWFTTAGVGANGTADVLGRLLRGASSICETAFVAGVIAGNNESRPTTVFYLDSPATTSATTYKLQARTTSANAFSIGGRYDGSYTGVSSFMVMEVSA